jgi:hypothetical protein
MLAGQLGGLRAHQQGLLIISSGASVVDARCSMNVRLTLLLSRFVGEERLSWYLLDMTQCIIGVLVAPSHFTGEPDQTFGIGQ